MVEMDAVLADAWHQDWSKDQEEAFALALRDNDHNNDSDNNNNNSNSTEATTLANTAESTNAGTATIVAD